MSSNVLYVKWGVSIHLAGKGACRVDETDKPPFSLDQSIAGSLVVRSGKKLRPTLLQQRLLTS